MHAGFKQYWIACMLVSSNIGLMHAGFKQYWIACMLVSSNIGLHACWWSWLLWRMVVMGAGWHALDLPG
jgi:hypothetical protein